MLCSFLYLKGFELPILVSNREVLSSLIVPPTSSGATTEPSEDYVSAWVLTIGSSCITQLVLLSRHALLDLLKGSSSNLWLPLVGSSLISAWLFIWNTIKTTCIILCPVACLVLGLSVEHSVTLRCLVSCGLSDGVTHHRVLPALSLSCGLSEGAGLSVGTPSRLPALSLSCTLGVVGSAGVTGSVGWVAGASVSLKH